MLRTFNSLQAICMSTQYIASQLPGETSIVEVRIPRLYNTGICLTERPDSPFLIGIIRVLDKELGITTGIGLGVRIDLKYALRMSRALPQRLFLKDRECGIELLYA